ncbi:MAG: hypothetical protein QW057_05535 [Candidatus Bathyarchaeia archaeon]
MTSPVSRDTIEKLKAVSCATAWAMLGEDRDNYLIRDVYPLEPSYKCVGPALTIQYRVFSIEALEEQRRHLPQPGRNVIGEAWERLQPGQVVVGGGGRGHTDIGIWGDCISTGFKARGAVGLVTDGAVRDTPMIRSLGLPVFTVYGLGTPRAIGLTLSREYAVLPAELGVPVLCGGVNVKPGDIILGDADGVVVIPPDRAEDVAEAGYAEEQLESLTRKLLLEGKPLAESYPAKREYVEQAGLLKHWETVNRIRARHERM